MKKIASDITLLTFKQIKTDEYKNKNFKKLNKHHKEVKDTKFYRYEKNEENKDLKRNDILNDIKEIKILHENKANQFYNETKYNKFYKKSKKSKFSKIANAKNFLLNIIKQSLKFFFSIFFYIIKNSVTKLGNAYSKRISKRKRRKIGFIFNISILSKYYSNFIIIISFIFMIKITKSEDSYILVKVKNGNNNIYADKKTINLNTVHYSIFYNDFNEPDEIYIDGNKQTIVKNKYLFSNKINFVKLIFKKPITNIRAMFIDCTEIIEVDMSHFDTSKVTEYVALFRNCKSLTSVNLSNLNTNNVTNMGWMFDLCDSIVSLDFSSLDTSKVTNMVSMFGSCKALLSLDLSNFNTSKVKFMNYMFDNDSFLKYINFKNAELNPSLESTFYNNNKITICSKYYGWKEKINGNVNLYINCINNLNQEEEIICYTKNGANFEFSDENICHICGKNYYFKDINSSKINCYECYSPCKTCKIEGNETNHNCVECRNNYTFMLKNSEYLNCYDKYDYYNYIVNNINNTNKTDNNDNNIHDDDYNKSINNSVGDKTTSDDYTYKYEFNKFRKEIIKILISIIIPGIFIILIIVVCFNIRQRRNNNNIELIEDKRTKELISNENDCDKKLDDNNKIIIIQFFTTDYKLNQGIQCHPKDIFVEVEQKLYGIYPDYKETNNYFTANGAPISRFKTIKENKLNDGDAVMLNSFDQK